MNSSSPLFFSQQERSIGLPGSRLVINPFAFEALDSSVSQADYADQPSLPLHLGYCCPYIQDDTGLEWRNASVVYSRIAEGGNAPALLWQLDNGSKSAWREAFGCGSYRFFENKLAFAISKDFMATPIYVLETSELVCDIDRTVLDIRLEQLFENSRLALKIRNAEDGKTVCLKLYRKPQASCFALSECTGWHGKCRIVLELHLLDEVEQEAIVSALCLRQITSAFQAASCFERHWEPSALMTEATYSDGSTLKISDYLSDDGTAVRAFEIFRGENFTLAGCCPAPPVLSDGRLQFFTQHFQAQISVTDIHGTPVSGSWRLYPSLADFLSDTNGTAFEEADTFIESPEMLFWSFTPEQKEKSSFLLAIQMGMAPAPTISLSPLRSQRLWDTLLQRIPRPRSFRYQLLDVDEDASVLLERMYYTAWAQVLSNILPPAPETNFPYAAMATGKSSLWAYGAAGCSYAASWETFYGWMLLAQLDPIAAWNGYEGFMELVDEEGRIGGESLPSVKARTAWVLYCKLADRERLSRVAPAIERYLSWRLKNLRWIYLDKTPRQDEKDIDFVTAALLDIYYFIRICRLLSMADKAELWQARLEELYQKMTAWFFAGDLPHQYFFSETGGTYDGNPLCILKALHLPMLASSERERLKDFFALHYCSEQPFCGFDGVKAENMSYTIYGLAENGLTEEAKLLRERTAYDIASTRFLAEEYCVSDGKVLPCGVRPSLFGCTLLIDCVLGMNGLRLDDGAPLPSGLNGAVYNVVCDGERHDFEMSDKHCEVVNSKPISDERFLSF